MYIFSYSLIRFSGGGVCVCVCVCAFIDLSHLRHWVKICVSCVKIWASWICFQFWRDGKDLRTLFAFVNTHTCVIKISDLIILITELLHSKFSFKSFTNQFVWSKWFLFHVFLKKLSIILNFFIVGNILIISKMFD